MEAEEGGLGCQRIVGLLCRLNVLDSLASLCGIVRGSNHAVEGQEEGGLERLQALGLLLKDALDLRARSSGASLADSAVALFNGGCGVRPRGGWCGFGQAWHWRLARRSAGRCRGSAPSRLPHRLRKRPTPPSKALGQLEVARAEESKQTSINGAKSCVKVRLQRATRVDELLFWRCSHSSGQPCRDVSLFLAAPSTKQRKDLWKPP